MGQFPASPVPVLAGISVRVQSVYVPRDNIHVTRQELAKDFLA